MSNKPYIVIGLPSADGHYLPDMSKCLDQLVAYSLGLGYKINLLKNFSSMIAHSRNQIAQKAVDAGADYLLFIDSDMTFDKDFLEILIKHNRDIVSGLCTSRFPPYHPVAKVLHDDKVYLPRSGLANNEGRFYSDLDMVGTAFMLIKTDVFGKVPKPWFAMPPYLDNGVMGEDVYFCRKAKENDYDICVDSALIVGHIGTHAYTIYDYIEYIKSHPEKEMKVELVNKGD